MCDRRSSKRSRAAPHVTVASASLAGRLAPIERGWRQLHVVCTGWFLMSGTRKATPSAFADPSPPMWSVA